MQNLVETWGQRPETVLEQATQNLRGLKLPRWEIMKNGVFRLASEVSYDESFLLVDRAMHQLPFASSMVCMPVNRGVLLAADGNSTTALIALLDEAQQCFAEMRWPMSGTMLALTDGRWQAYEPDSSAVAAKVGNLCRQVMAKWYSAQQEAMYRAEAYKGCFVSSYMTASSPDAEGRIRSACTWSKGLKSYLPLTDIVALCCLEGTKMHFVPVRWDDLMTVCGYRMKQCELDPPRFFVDSFPSDSELAVVNSKATGSAEVARLFRGHAAEG